MFTYFSLIKHVWKTVHSVVLKNNVSFAHKILLLLNAHVLPIIILKTQNAQVIKYIYKDCITTLGNNLCFENCGDGQKKSWEQCDDGNILPGDGCSYNC